MVEVHLLKKPVIYLCLKVSILPLATERKQNPFILNRSWTRSLISTTEQNVSSSATSFQVSNLHPAYYDALTLTGTRRGYWEGLGLLQVPS